MSNECIVASIIPMLYQMTWTHYIEPASPQNLAEMGRMSWTSRIERQEKWISSRLRRFLILAVSAYTSKCPRHCSLRAMRQ